MKATPRPWGWVDLANGNFRILASQGHIEVCPAIAHSIDDTRLIVRAVNRDHVFDELVSMLTEASLQIEYLHDKFQPTSTGVAVISRIGGLLAKARGES